MNVLAVGFPLERYAMRSRDALRNSRSRMKFRAQSRRNALHCRSPTNSPELKRFDARTQKVIFGMGLLNWQLFKLCDHDPTANRPVSASLERRPASHKLPIGGGNTTFQRVPARWLIPRRSSCID
jgi:hypothetical protein